MKKPNSPCQFCTERHIGCHSQCEGYIEYQVENRNYKDKLNKKRESEHLGDGIAIERARRIKDWYRKH